MPLDITVRLRPWEEEECDTSKVLAREDKAWKDCYFGPEWILGKRGGDRGCSCQKHTRLLTSIQERMGGPPRAPVVGDCKSRGNSGCSHI